MTTGGPVHTHFADWYRLADIEPKAETLEARWAGVQGVIKSVNSARALELVRLCFGREAKDPEFLASFQGVFKEHDAAFPMMSNELELSLLAGAALVHLWESRTEASDVAALATITATFESEVTKFPKHVLAAAKNYVAQRSISARRADAWDTPRVTTPNFEDVRQKFVQALQSGQYAPAATHFEPLFEKLTEWIKRVNTSTKALNDYLQAVIDVQQEESGIAWWVLGEYSRDLNKHLTTLELPTLCLLLGKELGDLTFVIPGPVAARAVLDRMLRLRVGDAAGEVTLHQVVNGVDRSLRASWNAGLKEAGVEDLAPIHFAVAKSLESDGPDDWIPAFRKATLIDVDRKRPAIDVGEQFYQERLFVRAASSSG